MTGAAGKSFRKCARSGHQCLKQGHHSVLPAVCAQALNKRAVSDVCHHTEKAQRWWLQLWESAGIISREVCYYPVNPQWGCEKNAISTLQENPECEMAHLVGMRAVSFKLGCLIVQLTIWQHCNPKQQKELHPASNWEEEDMLYFDVGHLNTPSEGGSPPGGRLSVRGCISGKISLFSESFQRAPEQAQMMGAGPCARAEGPALQRKDGCFSCDVRQQVGAERSLNDWLDKGFFPTAQRRDTCWCLRACVCVCMHHSDVWRLLGWLLMLTSSNRESGCNSCSINPFTCWNWAAILNLSARQWISSDWENSKMPFLPFLKCQMYKMVSICWTQAAFMHFMMQLEREETSTDTSTLLIMKTFLAAV